MFLHCTINYCFTKVFTLCPLNIFVWFHPMVEIHIYDANEFLQAKCSATSFLWISMIDAARMVNNSSFKATKLTFQQKVSLFLPRKPFISEDLSKPNSTLFILVPYDRSIKYSSLPSLLQNYCFVKISLQASRRKKLFVLFSD